MLVDVANTLFRFVEENYNLEIGNAQNTQLAKAIASGAEKGQFVLPKGKPLLHTAFTSLTCGLSQASLAR